MDEAYASAARRHYVDAKLLLGERRFDNAAYLAGYVVECSHKAVLDCCGGPAPASQGHELASLTGPALHLAVVLTPAASRYRVSHDADVQYAVHRWEPGWRYGASGMLAQSEAERLVRAAETCAEGIIHAMILDGRVGVL